jgi:hypothetical protein
MNRCNENGTKVGVQIIEYYYADCLFVHIGTSRGGTRARPTPYTWILLEMLEVSTGYGVRTLSCQMI